MADSGDQIGREQRPTQGLNECSIKKPRRAWSNYFDIVVFPPFLLFIIMIFGLVSMMGWTAKTSLDIQGTQSNNVELARRLDEARQALSTVTASRDTYRNAYTILIERVPPSPPRQRSTARSLAETTTRLEFGWDWSRQSVSIYTFSRQVETASYSSTPRE